MGSPPLPLLVMPLPVSLPSTKKDTAKKESHATSIVQDTRLNDDDDNAEQSQLAQRQPRNHFKTQRIQEAMSFAKTPVRHHELNPIHYNRLTGGSALSTNETNVSSGGNSTTATPNPPTTTPIPLCTASCVKEFQRCHNYHNNRQGKTCPEAFDQCRGTDDMLKLETCDCTASCVKEFQRCHNYHNKRKGKTCPQAFDQCRGEINQGHRRLAKAGCKKQCTSTDDMLEICDCTASCVKEFQRCHNHHHNKGKGKTCTAAFDQCRGEIDTGFRPLAKAGCKKQCTSTDDMLKLETCDESNGDGSDDGATDTIVEP